MRTKENYWHADDTDASNADQNGLKISVNQRSQIRFIRVQIKGLKYNLYKL